MEFDEEDDEFISRESRYADIPDCDDESDSSGTSRGSIESGASTSTPATSTRPLEDEDVSVSELGHEPEHDACDGWNSQGKAVVEETERFDESMISRLLDFWMRNRNWKASGCATEYISSMLAENSNIKRKD